MNRRTPVIAILLAPVFLYGLMLLFNFSVTTSFSVMKSERVLQFRLSSENPKTRMRALKLIRKKRPVSEPLLQSVVKILRTDTVRDVRSAAAHTLGQIGFEEVLPEVVKKALIESVMMGEDKTIQVAAIKAIGQSARRCNQYPDSIILHFAALLNESGQPKNIQVESIDALGKMASIQALPDSVLLDMHTIYVNVDKRNLREILTRSFNKIAASQPLPRVTLDSLADIILHEEGNIIRTQAIFTLAHSSVDYPSGVELINTVAQNKTGKFNGILQRAATNALKSMDEWQGIRTHDPISLALDLTAPVKIRLAAIKRAKSQVIKPVSYKHVLELAKDTDSQIRAAGVAILHSIGSSPDAEFDTQFLLPQLRSAMFDSDSLVRTAAYSALSKLFVHRPSYRHRVADFQSQINAGMKDANAKVRVTAMAALLRSKLSTKERDAILIAALNDNSPTVRQSVFSWVGYPGTKSNIQETLFAKAQQDPNEAVRTAAAKAQKKLKPRSRQSRSLKKHILSILAYVTMVVPIIVGGVFLLYYVARLLTYIGQKRRRAIAVIPVIMLWATASLGMFTLYFIAAYSSRSNTLETLQLTGILWVAILVYTALGWGMHYFVRR